MKLGTSHFLSKWDAVLYFKDYENEKFPYDETKKVVDIKIKEGSIHIGKPLEKDNERVFLNTKEGRYFIEEV